MACCGRGRSVTPTPPVQRGTPPALPAVAPKQIAQARPERPPSPQPLPRKIEPQIQTPRSPEELKPVPSSVSPDEDLPPCRYREFKSKQIIGGREIENYYCQAFSINIRQEHCRVCQKHDK